MKLADLLETCQFQICWVSRTSDLIRGHTHTINRGHTHTINRQTLANVFGAIGNQDENTSSVLCQNFWAIMQKMKIMPNKHGASICQFTVYDVNCYLGEK